MFKKEREDAKAIVADVKATAKELGVINIGFYIFASLLTGFVTGTIATIAIYKIVKGEE